ncbi:MAG: DUF1349 domain-containing protein [Thiothrix sp.]|nr:MAG: DUF1349 domain-containing protein [Thiothrix sp.]
MQLLLTDGNWLNQPKHFQLSTDRLSITTEPHTDLWQRSYYGFRNDNAPALLFELKDNFSLSFQVDFEYQARFDQCGVLIYLDSDNWFKASIEYENAEFSRLGSVVTNQGYSDWATQDISTVHTARYRLSRRGPDFLIEAAVNHPEFRQMRIFHLHKLGPTTPEMGKAQPPLAAAQSVACGFYACSPTPSSFTATFTEFKLEACLWEAHR